MKSSKTMKTTKTARYAFDEVRAALREDWGLALYRGGDMGDGRHDGRWDTLYSKTGYIVDGYVPGKGLSSQHYRTLDDVVNACGLAKTIAKTREKARAA